MAYLLEETLKFPKSSFKSMKYQPYEMKPNFSMYRVYEWHTYWNGAVYVSFSGGLDSTVLAYIVCQAYRKYGLDGKIPLVYVDTGTEYPEIREFVEFYTQWLREKFPELDIEKETLHPKHSFKWVCENKGFPITSKRRNDMSDFIIGHVTDPKEGPLDGVYAETKGTYTKFKGTGAFQKEKRILHQKVADVGIKASLQTGMVSINDRNRNQAIAVSITEMVAVLNEALRYGTAGMGKKVRL